MRWDDAPDLPVGDHAEALLKSVKRGGMLSAWMHGDIEVNWPPVARLIELSYRCNLCRR